MILIVPGGAHAQQALNQQDFTGMLAQEQKFPCTNPDSQPGQITQRPDGIYSCTAEGWVKIKTQMLHQPTQKAPGQRTAECKNIGEICPDGSIFIGTFGVMNERMYATGSDLSGVHSWNNGQTPPRGTPLRKCERLYASPLSPCGLGRVNTNLLADLRSGQAPYIAAKQCADLVAHGRNDWYLPGIEELMVFHLNRDAIGGIKDKLYWSSSEFNNAESWAVNFATRATVPPYVTAPKNTQAQIRCVRR